MNRENILKWVVDLETTTEPQATDALYDGVGYCCLGRLCKVAGLEFVPVDHDYKVETTGDQSFAPQSVIREFLGIEEYDLNTEDALLDPSNGGPFVQARYSDLNDNYKLSFWQIAAKLREDFNLEGF